MHSKRPLFTHYGAVVLKICWTIVQLKRMIMLSSQPFRLRVCVDLLHCHVNHSVQGTWVCVWHRAWEPGVTSFYSQQNCSHSNGLNMNGARGYTPGIYGWSSLCQVDTHDFRNALYSVKLKRQLSVWNYTLMKTLDDYHIGCITLVL